ncbi:MAG: hypothetical protein NTV60_00110 [Candidatus Kaiserbacteria bacterium]|nr:hypothetical protein [Candidatus Kaiserbacteria bacterium]
MRHFFISSFIALALAFSVQVPIAFADAGGTANGSACDLVAGSGKADGVVKDGVCISANTYESQSVAAKTAIDYSGKDDAAYNGIMIKIMSLFAWLVGVAALTLDYTVYYTVIAMGDFVHKLSAIGVTWRVLRDIGNIALIFGFLGIGISVILNVNWYGGKTKMLPMLLVGAVFLNFSLFFTEAVIDVGNLFATQFYKQINGGVMPTPQSLSTVTASNEGISNKIMSQLGLQTIYGQVKNTTTASKILQGSNSFFIGFMGILLFIVTAFVMFSLAFILIGRFIALIFLIIFAPIGFAGLAIPQLKARADKWWHSLFSQTITAPILMLMLYIALNVITDAKFLAGLGSGGNADWTGTMTNNLTGFAGIMLSFLVAMGLLLLVTIQAKNLSASGAGKATKLAGLASFGAISLAGRTTLGAAGNLLASKRMQSWGRSSNTNVVGKYAARGTAAIGKGLRSSTFDMRNMPGVSTGLGSLGVDAGKGASFTAKQAHDAQYGVKPVKEFFKRGADERDAAGREMDFRDAQADLAAGKITQAQHDAIVLPVLSKMSAKQLEELGGIKKGVDALVNNLSPQQFEALMKSDKLSDGEKDKIKDARFRPLSGAITAGNIPDIKKAVGGLSKGELEAMPASMFTDTPANRVVLENLTDKQRDTILDSKERTVAEKNLIRESSPVGKIETTFNTPALGGPAAAGAMLRGLPPAQIAKLKINILRDHDIVDNFTPAVLVALQEEKKLGVADIAAITANINMGAGPASLRTYIGGVGSAYWT